MNTNNNLYSSTIPIDHESGSSRGSVRIFDTPYNTYSSHSTPYSEYPPASKLEAFDYNYWPQTTTHNILSNPHSTILDQIQTPPSSSQTSETRLPVPSVHLSQVNSTTTISATHHHHYIHQHLYPVQSSSPPSTSNDPSNWLGSGEYQPLHSSSNLPPYRHYPTPCSLYQTNNFYDPSQPPQWATSPPIPPIKFESPYSSPPSYFESSDQCQDQIHKEDQQPSDSSQQLNWFKPQSSSTQFSSIPPKNPLNGKTRTRDKYRIVYTDQQRYELENEFIMSKYISIPRKSALSLTLALSERQIKIWFQNRRAKERKLNKKRHDTSTRQLNNSNDGDSPSDGGLESPNYYQNYA